MVSVALLLNLVYFLLVFFVRFIVLPLKCLYFLTENEFGLDLLVLISLFCVRICHCYVLYWSAAFFIV